MQVSWMFTVLCNLKRGLMCFCEECWWRGGRWCWEFCIFLWASSISHITLCCPFISSEWDCKPLCSSCCCVARFFAFGSVSWHCSIVACRHSIQCWYQLGIAWLCSSIMLFFKSDCIPVLNMKKAVCFKCMILLLELKVWQENEISIHPVESPAILQTKGCNDSQLMSKVRVNSTELFTSQPHSANLPDVCDKCYSCAKSAKRTCSS